jgi:hypothetical protein
MDGLEHGRRVALLRAEGKARARFAIVWRNQPDATAAIAAGCVESASEPLRRFDAQRRRPGPDALARADRSRCNRAPGAAT